MIGDIISHARMSRNKSKELAFEKKKTELLLYEVTTEGCNSFNMLQCGWHDSLLLKLTYTEFQKVGKISDVAAIHCWRPENG